MVAPPTKKRTRSQEPIALMGKKQPDSLWNNSSDINIQHSSGFIRHLPAGLVHSESLAFRTNLLKYGKSGQVPYIEYLPVSRADALTWEWHLEFFVIVLIKYTVTH